MRKVALAAVIFSLSVIALAAQKKNVDGPTGKWISANAEDAAVRGCQNCDARPRTIDGGPGEFAVALANPATGPMIALDLKTNASTGKATGTIGIGEHLVKYVTLQLEEGSVAGKTVKFKTRVKVNDAVQETSWLAELTDSGELTLREERPNKTIRTYSLRRAK